MSRNEANRPCYHFTPPQNWMNDPNGLVYHDGEYHLFYQYNPYETKWGCMSWGHAVSRDLVHWTDLPVAMYEEPKKGFTIFSGSAVVDWHNTSGFGSKGQPPLVAVYTADYRVGPVLEDIHIASSADRGRTFAPYTGNPVLHVGNAKFGDPKVFWHEGSQQWIMVAILGTQQGKVVIYGSPDLKTWRELSQFEAEAEAPGVWECPDLFPLPLGDDPQRVRWVLKVNCVSGVPTDRSRYFVGDFDGHAFRRDPGVAALVPERGDLYAEVTYNDIPDSDGRHILVGWIRQQASAARPWTGMQSAPRVLSLRTTPFGVKLCQTPVAELASLRGEHRGSQQGSNRTVSIDGDTPLFAAPGVAGSAMEIRAELEPGAAAEAGFCLHLGASRVMIGYATSSGKLFVERPGVDRLTMPLALQDGRVKLHMLIDRSVVEVFGGLGEATIAAVLEPDSVCDDVELFSRGGAAVLTQGDIWTLASIW